MEWPQIVVIVAWSVTLVLYLVADVKDDKQSSGTVSTWFLIRIAFYAAAAYVLHAGGFW